MTTPATKQIAILGRLVTVTEPRVIHLGPYRFFGVCPCGWHSEGFGTASAASRRLKLHTPSCRTAMALAWQKAHPSGEREGVAS